MLNKNSAKSLMGKAWKENFRSSVPLRKPPRLSSQMMKRGIRKVKKSGK